MDENERHRRMVHEVRVAAERDHTLSRTHLRVLAYACGRPRGLTDNSIHVDLRVPVGTANSARFELVQKGYLMLDPRGRTEKTSNGGSARVYVLADPSPRRERRALEDKFAALDGCVEAIELFRRCRLQPHPGLVAVAEWLCDEVEDESGR